MIRDLLWALSMMGLGYGHGVHICATHFPGLVKYNQLSLPKLSVMLDE